MISDTDAFIVMLEITKTRTSGDLPSCLLNEVNPVGFRLGDLYWPQVKCKEYIFLCIFDCPPKVCNWKMHRSKIKQ